MNPQELTFRRFAPLPIGLACLTFMLIVLGATTRLMNAGLSCPDWPLCNGRLIPTFEGGVFFEWFHRLVAASVSTLFLVMLAWILVQPALRQRLWKLAVFAVAMLVVQIVLGALTVLKLLNAHVVTTHLGTGTALFGAFLLLMALTLKEAYGFGAKGDQPKGLRAIATVSLAALYGQILLGGVVASHYASWACPDWPTCQGMWLPPMVGGVGLHMTHRFGAYAVAILVLALAWVGRKSPDSFVRRMTLFALVLVLAQVALGVANVLMHIPVPVSAAHNGLAEAIFATLVLTNFWLFARAAAPVARFEAQLRERMA